MQRNKKTPLEKKEAYKAYQKAYREAHKESLKEYHKNWLQSNPDYLKDYKLNNPEKYLEYGRKNYKKIRDEKYQPNPKEKFTLPEPLKNAPDIEKMKLFLAHQKANKKSSTLSSPPPITPEQNEKINNFLKNVEP